MKPWRSSFVTRWAALFASLIIAVVLVSGWLRDRASREYFLEDQRRNLGHRLEVIRVRVQAAIDAVRKDILYLSSAPAFTRLATAPEGIEREAALHEVGLHFMGGLQVRPTYFQARLIGVANGAREIIRFDQERGHIKEVPKEALQRTGDRDYFVETVKLPAGKFYFSEINLNQEFGRLSEPHTPTLRASMPIFDQAGSLFGIVIVNVDVTSFFEELRTLAGPDVIVTLSNSQGDYLLHPEPGKCFGFDLGRRYTLFDDHPQLQAGDRHGRFEDGNGELSITDEFPYTWDSDKSLIMRLALAKEPLLAPLRARRAQNFVVTVTLALIAGAVVIGVTHLFARGLRQVAEAVERYEPGKPLLDLPPDSPDEVGLLTRKFRDMSAKISEQMQGLRESRQRAEAAMRAREEFLATMSHEIRTPMNAVLGMAHLLETEGQGPHQAERLRTLKFAGRHLMALLNNLLDRERIESGDIVFDRLDFDLRDLLENLHRSLEPLASRKGLTFALEAEPGLPARVQGDPVRLYQVLNNLAHNAIKFTEHGQIFLRVQPGQQENVNFQISDTGPGLPAAVLETVRVSSAPPATAGLGLRISQRLIELLGGHLEVQSTPAGTTFFFSLQLPAGSGVAASRAPEEPPDLKGYSALVVEDVPSNQIVLGALLGKTNMAIDFATTAAQAREKLHSSSYDMAFVDIQLPDGNGAELALDLLQMKPSLRVVAVTAQVSPGIRSECEAAGVRAFVPKPIEPAELYDKLRRLTEPHVESIKQMFDHEEGKVAEYFGQLDREFQNWETEIRQLIESLDAERFRRLHHKMKNACGQLGLWKLDHTLSGIRETMEQGEREKTRALGASALRLIAVARQFTGVNRFNTSSR